MSGFKEILSIKDDQNNLRMRLIQRIHHNKKLKKESSSNLNLPTLPSTSINLVEMETPRLLIEIQELNQITEHCRQMSSPVSQNKLFEIIQKQQEILHQLTRPGNHRKNLSSVLSPPHSTQLDHFNNIAIPHYNTRNHGPLMKRDYDKQLQLAHSQLDPVQLQKQSLTVVSDHSSQNQAFLKHTMTPDHSQKQMKEHYVLPPLPQSMKKRNQVTNNSYSQNKSLPTTANTQNSIMEPIFTQPKKRILSQFAPSLLDQAQNKKAMRLTITKIKSKGWSVSNQHLQPELNNLEQSQISSLENSGFQTMRSDQSDLKLADLKIMSKFNLPKHSIQRKNNQHYDGHLGIQPSFHKIIDKTHM